MAIRGDSVHGLAEAVRAVRAAAAELSYPLPLPSAELARAAQTALLAQIDDYLLPRLARLDAPLLVVVGGSTGAGKSTLVNSLVQAPVSPAGVLRPTTRVPVLVCHPTDVAWFRSGGPLGSLTRTTGGGSPLQLIAAPALRAGLAFLDVPDFDAVVDTNRTLANQLLAAADLWLFVTTAARYADAVPWELLHTARERGTVVALVLDRMPQPAGAGAASATVEVVAHLTELLTGYGLGSAPLFVLPETRVGGLGLLPEEVLAPLRTWFEGLSADLPARAAVARCTLDGALAALPSKLETMAAAADEQVVAAEVLAEQVGMAYGSARATIEHSVRDGGLPAPASARFPARRGPAGHRRPGVAASGRSWLDRVTAARPAGGDHRSAWEASLVTLVCSAAVDAAEQAHAAWLAHPAGPAMIGPGPAGPSAGLAGKVERLARSWHGGVRDDLLHRVGELLDAEAARWLDGLAGVPQHGGPVQRLREAGTALEYARVAAALSRDQAAGGSAGDPAAGVSTGGPAAGVPSPAPLPLPGDLPAGNGADDGRAAGDPAGAAGDPAGAAGDPAGPAALDRAGR